MNQEKQVNQKSLSSYWPLITLIIISLLGAAAICLGLKERSYPLQGMHYFMGLLFCQFAMLKIFDVPGFADGFQMYDIIGKQFRPYALAYPFIELVLGLAYLSFLLPILTYLLTIFFMTIGVIGVMSALKRGLDIYCPCMGNVLKVPLSTVTLSEDLGMGIMALLMLLSRFL
ncbi:MAG: hypothetical protein Tsb0021_17060 [Chlamydiales bacterium]